MRRAPIETCLSTGIVWIVWGLAVGVLGALVGPGAAAIVAGLVFGVAGALVHAGIESSRWRPNWLSASPLIAATGLLLTWLLIGGDTLHPLLAAVLFCVYLVASCLFFPLADWLMRSGREGEA